jgi:quinoprotein glucose dehydrogenase
LRKLIFNDVNEVKEDIIFKDKIGRIRDIQIQPNTGKLFFLSDKGSLWKMESGRHK